MARALRIGGIVLCGGLSTRMGRPKAWLPFGDELLLPRVVRLLSEVVAPVVVVAARDQDLPPLPDRVAIVRDDWEACGPLAGLAAGLAALEGLCDAAYATACDVPGLQPAFVRRMTGLLDEYEGVVPRDSQFQHPLAAVYRTCLAGVAGEIVADGQRRLLNLLERARIRVVDVGELREVDPALQSLRNLNSPDDYEQALRDAGRA